MEEQASENSTFTPQIEPTPPKRSWLIAPILIVIALVVVGIAFLIVDRIQGTNTTGSLLGRIDPTPTSFPFIEMTVPYLRNRSYVSTLGQRDEYQVGSNYTSYLTSFDSDGLKINGLLTIPSGEKPANGWPAIVFVHGYIPPTLYATTEKYIAYVDSLARSGYVVFKIDLRGHGESEGTPGGGYYGSDYIVDTLNAYAALQASDFVNKNAIGIWGHSMAGNVALRSMAARPEIPATVIWAGAVYSYEDQRKYGINDQSYRPPQTVNQQSNRRRELFEKNGSPSAQSKFWQQVAPTNYLTDLKGAIQIDHAVDDTVVDIGYSRDLSSMLDETNVPHEFYEYQSGGHNIEGPSFNEAMQHTIDFYDKYLKKTETN